MATIGHSGARVFPLRTVDLAPFVRETAGRSNLRLCRDSYDVVPVVLGPSVDPVWADAASCARARR
jgi:hypothetical protein